MLWNCYVLQVFVVLFTIGLTFCFSVCFIVKILVTKNYIQKRKHLKSNLVIGFFHPYCNAGGGGERVLWCAVRAIQKKYPHAHCVVYTGDNDVSSDIIITKATKTFGIAFEKNVEFVFLHKRTWVEAKRYPLLTLLCQSLGSMVLGIEALLYFPPDVYLDTMGYAFTLPIFKYLGGCCTGCYIHYPTISTDMLQIVEEQNQTFNNHRIIARSKILTYCKLLYYRIFAWIYGHCGRSASTVMVNSSWTAGHIEYLWQKDKVHKIFPPCDIKAFLQFSLTDRYIKSKKIILSIGQFRPEKNHKLQVKVFHSFLSKIDLSQHSQYQLIMAGGCRNEEDKKRVEELSLLIDELGVKDYVKISTNITFDELKNLLQIAQVGIHTMANEHFGIGVVEFQASGVITLAHNSGGPKMDIIQIDKDVRTGFLADSLPSYSDALKDIFDLSVKERESISSLARNSCKRFSEEQFEIDFLNSVENLLFSSKKNR